ncbi:carboxymuconolactone decarboxylase family protein [Nocardia alni]|uniref:carboxymuconolactone decarboxylase family protein n=1 Tax=Nocardia alni TaxID=2815723 RepID=UPI001C24C4B7|nr:carboxymuconolactone decarboxylase family protein [Nocardia alni]
MPNVLGLFGHHIDLGSAWMAYNSVLMERPALDPRLRELIVLRVAYRTRSAYEWVQHTRIGQRCGLTSEQIDAVADGASTHTWDRLDALLLRATDQMIDRYRVDNTTWEELTGLLDIRQLLEALFVAGTYTCLAMVFNSVDLELDSEADLSSNLPFTPAGTPV